MMNGKTALAAGLLALAGGMGHHTAIAATFPYTENFDTDTLGTSTPGEPAPESGTFAPNLPGNWSVVAGGYTGQGYQLDKTFTNGDTGSRNVGASVDIPDLVGKNFIVSSLIRFDSSVINITSSNTTGRIGLAASGSVDGFPDTNTFYRADMIVSRKVQSGATPADSAPGTLRLLAINDSSGGFAAGTPTGTLTIAAGTWYRFTLSGTYSTLTNISLLFTVDRLNGAGDVVQTASLSAVDTSAITGSRFGYLHSAPSASGTGNSSTLVATADNFSVVPEPSALALLGVALGWPLVGGRRRRR